MRRVLLALMLLVASPAWGATYWVHPLNHGIAYSASGHDGSDSTTAKAVGLDWVNANAAAGSIIRFAAGTYSDGIAPANSGTSGSRIRYYGFPAHPEWVMVKYIEFGPDQWANPPRSGGGNYCTARWFTANGSTGGIAGCLALYEKRASYDSLVNLSSSGQTGAFFISGSYNLVDSISITNMSINWTASDGYQPNFVQIDGQRNHDAPHQDDGAWSWGVFVDSLKNSQFSGTIYNSKNGSHSVFITTSLNVVLLNNTFNTTLAPGSNIGYYFGMEEYEAYNTVFQGNTWNFVMNSDFATGTSATAAWSLRDSSGYNSFIGNTVTSTGTGQRGIDGYFSNGGSFGSKGLDQTTLIGNVFNLHKPNNAVVWYDGGMGSRSDLYEFNVFATTSSMPAMYLGSSGIHDASIWRHNTFYTSGGSVITKGSSIAALNSPKFVSNIYYGGSSNSSVNRTIAFPTGFAIDSAGVLYSAGGSSTYALSSGSLNSATVWGDPQFVSAPSNLHLLASSPAISGSLWDGYAGAYGTSVATTYRVTATRTAGYGDVFPTEDYVSSGGSRTFIFRPQTGYVVSDVRVDGVSVGAVNFYTLSNVTATHAISVDFALRTFTVYAAAGTDGTLSPSGTLTYSYGDSVVFALTANSGKKISALYVNDAPVPLTAQNTYKAGIYAPMTVQAFFVPNPLADPTPTAFTITATAGVGGYVTHAGQNSLNVNDTLTFAVVPYTGFHATAFTLDGISQLPNDTVTPTIIDDNRTVSVTFEPDSFAVSGSVTVNALGQYGGSVTPGITTIVNGGNAGVTITPNQYYSVDRVYVDGVDIGEDIRGYSIRNAKAVHSITATFKYTPWRWVGAW